MIMLLSRLYELLLYLLHILPQMQALAIAWLRRLLLSIILLLSIMMEENSRVD
jgi:hypothetical protein